MPHDKMQQLIWAVNAETLFQHGKWQGLRTDQLDEHLQILNTQGEFLTRGPLEEDESYKQVIAQVILQVGDEFLIHQITGSGSESRLHDRWALPVGGHLEQIDINDDQELIAAGMEREFTEEVGYAGNILERRFLGLMYLEDGNPVNHVHVGVFYLFKGDTKDINPTEDVIANMQFVNAEFLDQNKDNMTYWSQAVLPALLES